MKKLILKFANKVLSKDEMKKVIGGYDPYGCPAGACFEKSDCGGGCTSCSSPDGKQYGSCS